MAKLKAKKLPRLGRIHYTHFVPVKVTSTGEINHYATNDFNTIGNGGCLVSEKYRTTDAKNAKWFWSKNDAAAFCQLAGPNWVVLQRNIEYKQL